MANVVLTNKCNLKCKYCFAQELTKGAAQYFSAENFRKAIKFIKTGAENERLGIVGGEPTIHPYFGEFIEIINEDKEIKNCIIFTNGIELDKYIDILKSDEKFSLLINCNSPYDIGNLYNKLENNIKLLAKSGKKRYTLGINIYSTQMDWEYIFDLLEITKQHNVRASISVLNKEKIKCHDVIKHLKGYRDTIINFCNDCVKNEIVPGFECSSVIPCIADDEFYRVQFKLIELSKRYKLEHSNIFCGECDSQVDILPDLTSVRSICYPYYKKHPIRNFRTVNHLRNYFKYEVDNYLPLLHVSKRCKDCEYKINGQCNICPGYTMKNFMDISKYILSKS